MLANEAVFRKRNEEIQQRLDELRVIAKEDNQEYMVPDSDIPLHFVCECADENCKERIQLKPSEYNRIHRDRRQFVIVGGHEAPLSEGVVQKKPTYTVVKKYGTPPESPGSLQLTPIKNV